MLTIFDSEIKKSIIIKFRWMEQTLTIGFSVFGGLFKYKTYCNHLLTFKSCKALELNGQCPFASGLSPLNLLNYQYY